MNSYINYTTDAGDTFDTLALEFYNNEFKAHVIIQANPQHTNLIVLPAGLALKIPIIEESPASTLPPWKR